MQFSLIILIFITQLSFLQCENIEEIFASTDELINLITHKKGLIIGLNKLINNLKNEIQTLER